MMTVKYTILVFILTLVLQLCIKRYIPTNILEQILPDLHSFGHLVAHVYPKRAAESERYKPSFEKYDAWGKYEIKNLNKVK
jgi:hypothetical protein